MQGEILLFPIQHGITIEEIRGYSPSLAGLSLWNSSEYPPASIASEIASQLGVAVRAPSRTAATPSIQPYERSEWPGSDRGFGTFYMAPTGTGELPLNVEPDVDPLFLISNRTGPTGWIPLLQSKEDLEYVIEGEILRVQLSWGNSWGGAEFQAASMLSGEKPFALTIRRGSGQQIYLPTVVNRSPESFLTGSNNRSGWMTFLIQNN